MMISDIEIAQGAILEPIEKIAGEIGLTKDEIELYGKYKAKISDEYIKRIENNKQRIKILRR